MAALRVLHVVVGGDIGGAERLLVDLATRSEATRAEHDVALITPNPALEGFFRDRGLHVDARRAEGEGPLDFLRRAFGSRDVAWVVRLLRERRSNVVHTHTLGSHVLGTRAAERARLPQIRTEHHVAHYFDPSAAPFTRWAARRTQRFAAISQYVRAVVCKTAPRLAGRMSVVRNGVDTGHFTSTRAPQDPFRAAIVCRLTPWKRVHLAIEAAARCRTALTVVGDGKERATLEALARRLGAEATFVGHQADPRPYMDECDVTLSTSDHEPLGLSVLESLSMGRPVIAFAGGGIPEIVEHEVTGWLVDRPTPEAFAHALERARSDRARCREMGRSARTFVVEHASIEGMCEGYGVEYRAMHGVP